MYFDRPCRGREHSLSDPSSGLVRQYSGKGKDPRTMAQGKVRRVTGLLGGRPHEALGFHVPAKGFACGAALGA